MANHGTYFVNLGKDPELLDLGGRNVYKLRCAEKAANKKAVTRWFSALVGGPDGDVAARLAKGDSIAIMGEMSLTEYKPKKQRYPGEMVREDEMRFAKIFKIIKSPTFFADAPDDVTDAPAGDEVPDLEGL